MLVNLGIILFSSSHNFAYYAHRLHLLFPKYAWFNAHGISDS